MWTLTLQTPTGVHTLLWITVLVMALDVGWGYWIAHMRGEAQSNRLREGVVRRIYLLTVLLVLTLFASLKPDLFGAELLGREVNAIWIFYLGAIAAEVKSLSEKAEQLGLKDHPVIQLLRTLVGRWSRGDR